MTVDDNDPRIERCAFAKLQSVDGTFEYFIRKYEIVLGRNSKSAHADVVLGENSNISRKHAVISYNFAKGAFELTVLSKNGVTVDGTLCSPESGPVTLHSQDSISVADQTFFFLLPKDVRRDRARAAARANLQKAMADRLGAAQPPQPVVMAPPPLISPATATPTAPTPTAPTPTAATSAQPPWAGISPAALAALAAAQQQQHMLATLAAQQHTMATHQQQLLAAQQQQAMHAAAQQQAAGAALNGGEGNVGNLLATMLAQQQQPPPPS